MTAWVLVGDAMRVAVLAFGGGILGLCALTGWVYGRRYWLDARLARAQGVKLAWRGLLPSHVLWVSLSYVLLTVVCVNMVYRNIDRTPTWRTFAILIAATSGAWSMWQLHRWQRRLYPRHDEAPPVTDLHDPPDAPPGR